KKANINLTQNAINAYVITSLMSPAMTFIISASNIAIVWFGAHLIAGSLMPVGNLLSFITYATQMLFSFMQLSMIFVVVPRAQASAQRIQQVLDIKDTINDPIKPKKLDPIDDLKFSHVDFTFSGSSKKVLDDINFEIHKGQTLAIIGGTGSGKSSLINFVPRLFDVAGGKVLINGDDVSDFSQSDLHKHISFTSQKSFLFEGTVRGNLKYGNSQASEQDMNRALEIAQANSFIQEQGGLDAPVEQGGNNFSGGQIQRLSIARAVIKRADIYIFDDTFSALDFKTDANLRQALSEDKKIKNAIKIIVAQRVSTVADADQILVLEDGKISGLGTHQELLKNNSIYKEIVDSQLHKNDILAKSGGKIYA
ncbi:ABC transporter ATP-binding protein, partial [Oenococcus oeni]